MPQWEAAMAHPMGESKPRLLRVGFDRRLKLEFRGSQISSDGGLLPYRELDYRLGLSALAGNALSEVRRAKNTRHLLKGLLRLMLRKKTYHKGRTR